jgi:CheY-like chemotaxis protein
MTQTVLDIGNCNPDHASIQKMLTSKYDVVVLRAHQLSDALELLGKQTVDFIVINRKLDIDYSDGIEILRHLKKDSATKSIPVMIITNYPEQQQAAVAEGAEYGFGKLEYAQTATHERLSRFLKAKVV